MLGRWSLETTTKIFWCLYLLRLWYHLWCLCLWSFGHLLWRLFQKTKKFLWGLQQTLLDFQWIFISTVSQLLYALTWGGECVAAHTEAKKTLRREPLRAGNQPTEPTRVLGLRLKSDSIDVCLFKSTIAFLTGPAPKSSWLFTIALLATENQNSQASWTGNFLGPMGIRTNNTHSVIFYHQSTF